MVLNVTYLKLEFSMKKVNRKQSKEQSGGDIKNPRGIKT